MAGSPVHSLVVHHNAHGLAAYDSDLSVVVLRERQDLVLATPVHRVLDPLRIFSHRFVQVESACLWVRVCQGVVADDLAEALLNCGR